MEPHALGLFVPVSIAIVVTLVGVLVIAIIIALSRSNRAAGAAGTAPEAPSPVRGDSDHDQRVDPFAATDTVAGSRSRPPAPAIAELQPHFPDFEILDLLGQGGMGAVYRARRIADRTVCALKVVSGDGEQGEVFAARFLREAEALHRLDHPNIVAIRAHGRSGAWCWVLMDLIEGANLRQVVATGALSPEQTLALVPPLCAALQYAHDQGVVHRDLKPENILIDQRGQPHLVDFGLAKLKRPVDGESLTVSGQTMGSMHYMAPEQVERARGVDHRADIYALGVVIYELLTGRLPLGRFEPPSQKVAVDVRIDEVVLRALERDPERRWQQASHVSRAVEDIGPGPAALPRGRTSTRPWGMDVDAFSTLLHLSQLAGYVVPGVGWILPIVMWASCRDLDPIIDAHGRNVINWIISHIIYGVVFFILCFVLIGIPLLIVLAICAVVFPIIGAIQASSGRVWRYPGSITFLAASPMTGAARRLGATPWVLLIVLLLVLMALPLMLFVGSSTSMRNAHRDAVQQDQRLMERARSQVPTPASPHLPAEAPAP